MTAVNNCELNLTQIVFTIEEKARQNPMQEMESIMTEISTMPSVVIIAWTIFIEICQVQVYGTRIHQLPFSHWV